MKAGDLVIPHERIAPALHGAHWSGVVLKRFSYKRGKAPPIIPMAVAGRWLVAWTVTERTGRVVMQTSHHPQNELQIISE